MSRLLHLYVERFNQRDWDGLRELIRADARLQVADRFSGHLADSPYFGQYDRRAAWRMALGEVDGHAAVVALCRHEDGWRPQSVARLELVDGRVVRIVDYVHCPWLLANAVSLAIGESLDVSLSVGRP